MSRFHASELQGLVKKIQGNLTPDLLKSKWKNQRHPLEGYCYVASEALWHLLNKEEWKPCVASYEDDRGKTSHWWLVNKNTGQILDPTKEQFVTMNPPYHLGKGCAFLTQQPSKRAQKVLDRIHAIKTR